MQHWKGAASGKGNKMNKTNVRPLCSCNSVFRFSQWECKWLHVTETQRLFIGDLVNGEKYGMHSFLEKGGLNGISRAARDERAIERGEEGSRQRRPGVVISASHRESNPRTPHRTLIAISPSIHQWFASLRGSGCTAPFKPLFFPFNHLMTWRHITAHYMRMHNFFSNTRSLKPHLTWHSLWLDPSTEWMKCSHTIHLSNAKRWH